MHFTKKLRPILYSEHASGLIHTRLYCICVWCVYVVWCAYEIMCMVCVSSHVWVFNPKVEPVVIWACAVYPAVHGPLYNVYIYICVCVV